MNFFKKKLCRFYTFVNKIQFCTIIKINIMSKKGLAEDTDLDFKALETNHQFQIIKSILDPGWKKQLKKTFGVVTEEI